MRYLRKLKVYLRQIYCLSLSVKSQERIVWNKLKKLHIKANFKHGVYENDKMIESIFSIAENTNGRFFYFIEENNLCLSSIVVENFPQEMTTDLFVLASHFNNLLKRGVVVVDVNNKNIIYNQNIDILLPLLNDHEIFDSIRGHFNMTKDIYWSFNLLITQHEEPAIVIAELFKKNEERNDKENSKIN
jgi:hypothetical protein